MAASGKGRGPLVADRRYASARKAATGGTPPRKPAPKRAAPRRSNARNPIGRLVVGLVSLIWRIIWGTFLRVGIVSALILGMVGFYFYSRLTEGRVPLEGNGCSTNPQQVANQLCLGVPYDTSTWKSEAYSEDDCHSG